MFRSRFLWKLFATYVVVVLFAASIIGVLLQSHLQRVLSADYEANLSDQAHVLMPFAVQALTGTELNAQDLATRMGQDAGSRITLVLPDGTVLADSDQTPLFMDNHLDRPELVAARATGSGVSRRFSETLQRRMLYVARAVHPAERVLGYVRVAMPMSVIEARLAASRRTLLLGASVAVLLALVLGLVVARRITSPIVEMTAMAEALRAGRRARVSPRSSDELGILGHALNRFADEGELRLANLGRQRAQLDAILSGVPAGVVAVDEDERIVFVNRTVANMLGLPEEDVAGRHVWEVVRIAEVTELIDGVRETLSPGLRSITLHSEAGQVDLDVRATPFAMGDETGVVVIFYDLTTVRRLERVRRDFVANVSHELKTPLTSMSGFVETLLDGAIHDSAHNVRFLEKIDLQVDRLISVVDDLLELARVESPAESVHLQPVAWKPVLDNVVARHAAQIEAKGLTLELRAPEEVRVYGDPRAMDKVLDNLVDNAVKYTGEGGRIGIEVTREERFARVDVVDTGRGIPAKDLRRVFERFYRVDKARSQRLGGTGLGLSIVKNLVLSMSGTVDVDSEIGVGSRFTVHLPLVADAAD